MGISGFFATIIGYPMQWIYSLVQNYGISIIILTVIVRLCLLPLYAKQIKTSAKMAGLQAKQKEIQSKYANNRQKMNEELQALYQKEGVSTMSGCLPLIIQLPIIYGLFALLRNPLTYMKAGSMIAAVHESFLWIPDLSQPDAWLLPIIAAITTYFSALTAYGVHVYNFRAKNLVFTFIMAVMMIPAQVSALGFVQMMNKIHLTNSFIPLILPAVAAPVVFFYMKQYMESVLPLEIVEAARVDGSNEFRTFNTIILPIMKPALAVQAIFSFVSSWNNYFIPALLLDKAEMKTVPIMIAQLRSADYSKFDMGKVYMFILLAILPVMLVYIILSKSIIKGVTSGSVKG